MGLIIVLGKTITDYESKRTYDRGLGAMYLLA